MATTRVARVLDRPCAVLWERLSDYRGWQSWLREVADSVMEDGIVAGPASIGIIRRVGDPTNPLAREMLVGLDASTHTLSYCAVGDLPMPARNYQATVRLIPLSDSSATLIDWSGSYDADAGDEQLLTGVFVGLYDSFIDALLDCTAVLQASPGQAARR
jgi:hypothetical protein